MRLFYCSDLHGSRTCFMKFINAAKFYRADLLLLGGDLTGKSLVTLVEAEGGGYTCDFQGRTYRLTDEAQAVEMERLVRSSGAYPVRTTAEEVARLEADPDLLQQAFLRQMREELSQVLQVAEERLGSQGIHAYLVPGNDDPPEIDAVFEGLHYVHNVDEAVVDLPGTDLQLLGLGYANTTPWHAPRDIPDPELGTRLHKVAAQLKDPARAIWMVHAPPLGSGLDVAAKLDADFRPVTVGGSVLTEGVGSRAVAEAVKAAEPLLSLHGHIHESAAVRRLTRRSVSLNAGSEYSEGILRGAVIDIERGRVVRTVLTTG